MGQLEFKIDLVAFEDLVPAIDARLAVRDIVVTQPLINRQQRILFGLLDLVFLKQCDLIAVVAEFVIVVDLGFLEPALEPRRVVIRGVGGKLISEQIDRYAEMEIDIALQRRQIDGARGADLLRILGFELLHHLAGTRGDPRDAGRADEHMMTFLGQHKAAGARHRIEAGFGQRGKLILAIAVGEEGEHVIGEPVRRFLIEGAENTRLVRIAGMTFQHRFGFLPPVAPEIGVQQIDHRPEMTPFLHIHLEQISQIIERGAGQPEQTLLFDGGGFRIALGYDQPAQRGAIFTRDLLPDGFALMFTERNPAVFLRRGQKDTPAVIRHFDVIEMRPAIGLDADRGPQIDVVIDGAFGAQILPPVEKAGLPGFQRPLQAAVVGQIDIVWNAGVQIDGHYSLLFVSRLYGAFIRLDYDGGAARRKKYQTRRLSNSLRCPVP